MNTGSASADRSRHAVSLPAPPLVAEPDADGVHVRPADPDVPGDLDLSRVWQRRLGQAPVGPQPNRVLRLPERLRRRAQDRPQQRPVPSLRRGGPRPAALVLSPTRATGRNAGTGAPPSRRPTAAIPGTGGGPPASPRGGRRGPWARPPPGHRRTPEVALERLVAVVGGPVSLDPVGRGRAVIQPGGTYQRQVVVAHHRRAPRRSSEQSEGQVDRTPHVRPPVYEVAQEDHGTAWPVSMPSSLPTSRSSSRRWPCRSPTATIGYPSEVGRSTASLRPHAGGPLTAFAGVSTSRSTRSTARPNRSPSQAKVAGP